MAGVSIGYFDPTLFNHDIGYLTSRLKRVMPVRRKAWPLAVSSIRRNGRGTGVAYAVVDGHVPIHIDTVGLDDADGRIFQFVLEVENRPCLMTAPAGDANTPIFMGFAEGFNTFGLGAMELHVGMAVHFDITTHFHGVSGMPLPGRSMDVDHRPRAVIIQVAGFDSTQIGDAVEHARELVRLDRGFWDRPQPHKRGDGAK